MQTSYSKKMERAGLLKRLLDIFRSLTPQAERDPADEILDVGRIAQAATEHILKPSARLLRDAQDLIATAMPNQRAIFWIADKQTPMNIMAR
jgi:hypothetical protein